MLKHVLTVATVLGVSACTIHTDHPKPKITQQAEVADDFEITYDRWTNEMVETNNAHGEALLILEDFREKIEHHKSEIASFATYIADNQRLAESLSATGEDAMLAALEVEILENSAINAAKHRKFTTFLRNLAALDADFEKRLVMIETTDVEDISSEFISYDQALTHWATEMDAINSGHDQALLIIDRMQSHIEGHENAISKFGYKITRDRSEADSAEDKEAALGEIEMRIDQNLGLNRQKHDGFKVFLSNLRDIKHQFEG